MITDYKLTFSNDQAFTDTAASTNVIDLTVAAPGVGNGEELYINIQPTVAYATITSVNTTLQTDADEAFGSPVTLASTGVIAIANLIPTKPIKMVITEPTERYLRLLYTVVGGSTAAEAGRMHSALVFDRQTNQRG